MVLLTFITGLFPPFRQTFTHAQERSADRIAAKFAPETIERGLILLAAGKNLYPDVDRDAYLEQLRAEKQDVFLRVVNLMSSHPILVKRVVALDEIHKHGMENMATYLGKLDNKPFLEEPYPLVLAAVSHIVDPLLTTAPRGAYIFNTPTHYGRIV